MQPMVMTYSAFPSFYQKFVNNDKAFTLEEAVFKTSTQAAIRHEIKGRGVITEGAYADVLLLNMDQLKVLGTPLNPRVKPRGIEYVLVNGVPVIEKSVHMGLAPGRVLRKGRDN